MTRRTSKVRSNIPVHSRSRDNAALHARRILRVYQTLSNSGAHLLDPVLNGKAPTQWAHYPDDDAVDIRSRFQWYYHSHSPDDRSETTEHGHFHVFARTDARRSLIDGDAEAAFLKRMNAEDSAATTRHLLAIGLSSVGVPISLFTVNRWVTGDQLLSSKSSLRLLQSMSLQTGHRDIDHLITSIVHFYQPQVRTLFRKRDQTLFARARHGAGTLEDESVEILSEIQINLDRDFSTIRRGALSSRDPSQPWRS